MAAKRSRVEFDLSPADKARLGAMAAVRGLTMSALVAQMIDALDRTSFRGRAADLVRSADRGEGEQLAGTAGDVRG